MVERVLLAEGTEQTEDPARSLPAHHTHLKKPCSGHQPHRREMVTPREVIIAEANEA